MSAYNIPGSSTVNKLVPAPLPKIPGTGALVNDTTLSIQSVQGGTGFGMHIKYDINDLTFINAHTGWLAAEVDDPQHPFPGLHDYPSTLFVTHDGGITWQQPNLTLPAQKVNRPYSIQPLFETAQE